MTYTLEPINPPSTTVETPDLGLAENQILYINTSTQKRLPIRQLIGIILLFVALGAFVSAFSPIIFSELNFRFDTAIALLFAQEKKPEITVKTDESKITYNPLANQNGTTVLPINTDFAIIIPKLGINSPVVAGVNPGSWASYTEALKKGVAHSASSFYPNENGAVYLFSHSTNYEWFVRDLNAIFYLIKDLEPKDPIVIIYMGHRYTYEMRDKKIVSSKDLTYLQPIPGQKRLILQTCYPPGTTLKRLLLFADLVDERPYVPEI